MGALPMEGCIIKSSGRRVVNLPFANKSLVCIDLFSMVISKILIIVRADRTMLFGIGRALRFSSYNTRLFRFDRTLKVSACLYQRLWAFSYNCGYNFRHDYSGAPGQQYQEMEIRSRKSKDLVNNGAMATLVTQGNCQNSLEEERVSLETSYSDQKKDVVGQSAITSFGRYFGRIAAHLWGAYLSPRRHGMTGTGVSAFQTVST